MSLSKRGIAILSAIAAVLVLMAIGSSALQAEPGSFWSVNGFSIGTKLLPLVQNKEIEKLPITGQRHLTLLGMIGKNTVEILCTGLTLINVLLHQEGKVLGKLLYEGCKTIVNGTEQPACRPTDVTAGHITAEFKGLIVLHEPKPKEKEVIVLLEPKEAEEPFAVVYFGEECSLGEEIPITGKFYVKDCNQVFDSERVTHLVEENSLSDLLFGKNPAKLEGSVILELAGEHKGMTWRAIAA